MEDKSLHIGQNSHGISDALQNYIDSMVEEIVLEGRPFDTQKKYLKKFCENEGVDYNKVTKGVSELVDTLTEYVSSKSENLLKLIQYQAKDACVTDESITFIIEQAVNSKDLSEVALFHI
jgi:hypothetical protein